MNHVAELAIHQYLTDASNGKSKMSDKTIDTIATDIKDALKRQFGSNNRRKEFSLRMSNIGRPSCQLWFEKNQPEKALPKNNNFVMNMMLGDIVEAVFKGVLTEAKIKYKDSEKCELKVDDTTITGTYDLIIDDAVDDIKSASDWSYRNKFKSFEILNEEDSFGYVSQLVGYADATNTKVGGWWAVNKATGEFKYVSASSVDLKEQRKKIKQTVTDVNNNVFKRCFEPEEETFRGKLTGNKVLNKNCRFCSYRKACWPKSIDKPAVKSIAKDPKIVSYIELSSEYQ